jgi:hypothetical protein
VNVNQVAALLARRDLSASRLERDDVQNAE